MYYFSRKNPYGYFSHKTHSKSTSMHMYLHKVQAKPPKWSQWDVYISEIPFLLNSLMAMIPFYIYNNIYKL